MSFEDRYMCFFYYVLLPLFIVSLCLVCVCLHYKFSIEILAERYGVGHDDIHNLIVKIKLLMWSRETVIWTIFCSFQSIGTVIFQMGLDFQKMCLHFFKATMLSAIIDNTVKP